MTDWFSPEVAPYFSLLSLTAGVAGFDYFARRGEHRGLVTTAYAATAVFGAILLAAGLVGLATGQPWYVPFALGFSGAVILPSCLWAIINLKRVYSESELRRSLAKDL
jgi:hypothetical protein